MEFFISDLARWLRTRRFSEPTFRPAGASNHWKNTVFRDFPTFSRICIFFLLTLSLLLFSLLIFSLLSASALLCFSSVHIVESLTSKLRSIMCICVNIYIYMYNLAGAPWRIPWWKLVKAIGFCLEPRQAAMYGPIARVSSDTCFTNFARQSYLEVPLAQTCKLAARNQRYQACQNGGGKVEWSGFSLHMYMCLFLLQTCASQHHNQCKLCAVAVFTHSWPASFQLHRQHWGHLSLMQLASQWASASPTPSNGGLANIGFQNGRVGLWGLELELHFFVCLISSIIIEACPAAALAGIMATPWAATHGLWEAMSSCNLLCATWAFGPSTLMSTSSGATLGWSAWFHIRHRRCLAQWMWCLMGGSCGTWNLWLLPSLLTCQNLCLLFGASCVWKLCGVWKLPRIWRSTLEFYARSNTQKESEKLEAIGNMGKTSSHYHPGNRFYLSILFWGYYTTDYYSVFKQQILGF